MGDPNRVGGTTGGASRTWALTPMFAVARRLRLGVRLVMLAVVLLIPTGVLAQAFLSATNSQIGFARQERDGVAVLTPALVALSQTVAGEQVDLTELTSVVHDHPDLKLDDALTAVTAAEGTADTAAGRASLGSALADFLTATGNNSNLILDPDLDSFYVMDSLVVQLPTALVSGAQAAIGPQQDTAAANVADQAVLAGSVAGAAAALSADADTALENTEMQGLEPQLADLRKAAEAATALQNQLSSTLDHPAAADPSALGVAAEAAVTPTAAALDALLEARIGRQAQQQQRIVAVTVVNPTQRSSILGYDPERSFTKK